jgi:hypothetical protein
MPCIPTTCRSQQLLLQHFFLCLHQNFFQHVEVFSAHVTQQAVLV